MSYGNCVLTSDIPENKELVEGYGFTFREGDVGDLRHMLTYLIENPDIAEASGTRSRKLIEGEYTWDKIALQAERMFLCLLGSN